VVSGASPSPAAKTGTMFPRFDRRFFECDERFTCFGRGDLGGKALGLALISEHVLPLLDPEVAPGIEVVLPRLTVITTDLFDAFMQRNDLLEVVCSDLPDDRLAHAFQQAYLPVEMVGDLRGLISGVRTPLAVRSSSLLEDALAQPFAGVYCTKMLPNNQHAVDERFARLVEAVKLVFASTFFAGARDYRRSLNGDRDREKMAVIVQEVVGERHGDLFYPDISGVARSYSYYPQRGTESSDGVASLSFGLGKTIVDGGLCWTYSPARPTAPPPFGSSEEMMKNTQTHFWAVDLAQPAYDPVKETEYMLHAPVEAARGNRAMDLAASTYDCQSDRLRPGTTEEGPLVLNFASLLGTDLVPLNDGLTHVLDVCKEVVGADVEIEFALRCSRRPEIRSQLGLLQVRPISVNGAGAEVSPEDLVAPDVVVSSSSCLGHGCVPEMRDVVFLKPECFTAAQTMAMAAELAAVNRRLAEEGSEYLLIGFGRWGSSEPWLGVPVSWGQISGAKVIVEASCPEMRPDMSEGSHFFHNLTSLGVLYLSVPEDSGLPICWDWLAQQETVHESRFVKHVRTRSPLTVRVDGRSRRGVVAR
jgi:hypothetical protein